MTTRHAEVSTVDALLAATRNADVQRITVTADLTDVPTLRLLPGQRLIARAENIALRFAPGSDGLQLSSDNSVEALHLFTDPVQRVLFNDTQVTTFGRLVLRDLHVAGVVRLLARDKVRSGHVEIHGLDIVYADARGFDERPKGYGVEVIPGAFTLWNMHADRAVTITAELTGLSAGRAGSPVRGSGIFVSGGGDTGGRLVASRVETGAVFSDGGIAAGTPDRISGGVFIVSGAVVDSVRNLGAVSTYGPNDMVLDNWGTVDRWIADEKITSHGPSGIGFVNFGTVNVLQLHAPIETFGQGARGFNVYAGTVNTAEFERVVTHADGAVGIQISQPVGEITVRRGIETHGAIGDSLVKGVVVKLPATPLSVKPGGAARKIDIRGGLLAHGAGVDPLELHGAIESIRISGGFAAVGESFEGI